MKKDVLSVILLSYKSKERLIVVRNNLDMELSTAHIPYELIIIDDGSNDGSYEIAYALEKKYDNVKAYELSRNYTSHYAIFAGFQMATGDCATVIADDEQKPYHILVELYHEWQKGNRLIFPYRIQRDDPWPSRLFAKMFYKIMSSISDFAYPPHGIDSFFIDREIIEIINNSIHPINTTTVTELLRLGYNPVYLPYIRGKSTATKSRWTFKKKVKLAKDWFFSTSSFPIKLITFVGFFISLFAFCLILFYSYIKLFGNPDYWRLEVQGWVSIVILISFFSGLILLSLGIIAEYIWRIYEEVKNRPGYIIKKKEK
ncbi:MAG TPA: glycosyltransferase [Saprospiraceae bacterium]|nr:glycosyltransferase [Saprospiraceae bacterium]